MKFFIALVVTLSFFVSCQQAKKKTPTAPTINTTTASTVTLIVQPFIGFPEAKTDSILQQLKSVIPTIILNKPIPLPTQSYSKARNRYRADTIIALLSKMMKPHQVIIGLTEKDISVTKGNHADWGVMGLGYRPGNACVVSLYRLKAHQKSQLYKVCIHELGHTAGLDHCPVKSCYMRDAEGGNPLDEEVEFCTKCFNYLKQKGWRL